MLNGQTISIDSGIYNQLVAHQAAGQYTEFYRLLSESGSQISTLYVAGPTGFGAFGQYSHQFTIDVIGQQNFDAIQLDISDAISGAILSDIVDSEDGNGNYFIPSSQQFIQTEIETWTTIEMPDGLFLPIESYAGWDLLDWADPFGEGGTVPFGNNVFGAYDIFDMALNESGFSLPEIHTGFAAPGTTITYLDVDYVLTEDNQVIQNGWIVFEDDINHPGVSFTLGPTNGNLLSSLFAISFDALEWVEIGYFMGALASPSLMPIAGAAFLADIISPLVIDLDGDGVELIALENSTAIFDLDLDGYAQHTGWVSPDDALLALDIDGDGIIDDGSELFGDQTGFGNGFLALAAHDSNNDGVIDALDTVFADLVVWQDVNGDGFSAESEMFSLTDVGITSIDLGYTNVNETNEGHSVLQSSTVTFANGDVHDIDDVYFENDPRASVALLPDNFQYHEDAFKLPALFGYGHIASTWVVLSENATLRQDAADLVADLGTGDVSGFLDQFEDYILAWAGVDGVDPNGRGSHVNGQHLAFLEAAYGQDYDFTQGQSTFQPNPEIVAGDLLTEQFHELMLKLAGRFIAQSAVSDGLLNATDQASFDAILNAHVFGDFTDLIAEYSPSNRSVEGELTDVFDSILASTTSGALSLQNAALTLLILQKDLEPDLAVFQAAFAAIAVTNPGALSDELNTIISNYDGQMLLFGTSGDDVLTNLVDGIYVGGEGNDTLAGSDDADVFIYAAGDGSDTITRAEQWSGDDKLVFTNLNEANVAFSANAGGDLLITMPDGSVVTVIDHFSDTNASLEEVVFADGNVLDIAAIAQKSIEDQKATGYVIGGSFEDTYTHISGDGSYTIEDKYSSSSVKDRLVLSDQTLADVTFGKGPDNDLIITLSNGEVITIKKHFQLGLDYDIEEIEFSDGTVLTAQNIRDKTVADQKASETVEGSIYGENYSHSLGDGSYEISDYANLNGQTDKLTLTDQLLSEVQVERVNGDDLQITLSNGEVITIANHFAIGGDYQMEQLVFSDGLTLDTNDIDTLLAGPITLTGTAGNDTIDANYVDADGDVLNGNGQLIETGDGYNVVYDGAGDDTVIGGVTGTDKFFAGGGADHYDGITNHKSFLYYTTASEGLTLNLSDTSLSSGIAQGDSYANLEWLHGTDFADTITTGNSGVRKLSAGAGDDIIIDGGGQAVWGGAGNDTFVFNDHFAGDLTINDFTQGQDKLDVSGWGVTSMDDLTFGSGTNRLWVNFDDGTDTDRIRINGGNWFDGNGDVILTADDFIFA